MASRRKLKKTIKFVTTEIITEIYVLSFFKEIEENKLSALIAKAAAENDQLVSRISHADGKEDPKIVKAYFKSLREDWIKSVEQLSEEAGKL